jgi:ribosomal-protein-alanine N-acetyltransferase
MAQTFPLDFANPGAPLLLQTPRLGLRPFTWDDLDELARISADPETRRFMWAGPLTRAQTADNIRLWQAQYAQGLGFLAVVHRATGELIGQCGLDRDEARNEEPEGACNQERISIGYMIHREQWGQGLATEAAQVVLRHAFANLEFHRIWACTNVEHWASRRVMEKLGMRFHHLEAAPGAGMAVYYTVTRAERAG